MRFRAWRVAIGRTLLLAALCLGCGSEENPTPAIGSTDPAGSRKIASLDPIATNLLLELDRSDRIIAVDQESARLPGLERRARVPDTDDEAFLLLSSMEADLVALPTSRIELAQRLAAANVRTIIVLVRHFDDGFTLFGELAGRVGLASAARDRIAATSRPLAAIESESEGFTRPRVAVVESFEPLVLVGDDQLATALVEIAGGENVTNGRGPASIPIDREELVALEPALLFHTRPTSPSPNERDALAASVSDIAPLVVTEFDPTRFYAPSSATAARTLRAAIAPLSQPLAQPTTDQAEPDEASAAPETTTPRRTAKEF